MKRKFLNIIFCAFMFMALAGCSGNGGDGGTSQDVSSSVQDGADDDVDIEYDNLIKVGIINNDPDESGYRAANDRDMQDWFTAENGYYAFFRYGVSNEEQIKEANELLQNGIDYLLISAQEKTGWDGVLQDAEAAGTRVILFDRTVDVDESLYDAAVISNMENEGRIAVKWLEEKKLKEYNIIHIQGKIGNDAQLGRTSALEDAVASHDWNLVTQQPADWNMGKAREIVETAIASGADFNVIYAENDDMAKGAVYALDAAGISHGVDGDVIIMGFDCNKFALEELLNGNWNYDGQCNPFHASYIDNAIKKLEHGEEIEDKIIIMDEKWFDTDTITQEDVDKYGV